jgi:hypothetical protein
MRPAPNLTCVKTGSDYSKLVAWTTHFNPPSAIGGATCHAISMMGQPVALLAIDVDQSTDRIISLIAEFGSFRSFAVRQHHDTS